MYLKAAVAAGACLLVAACGGGVDGDIASVGSSASAGSSSSTSSTCQPQTTVIGGNLFVAEQGPVGVSLVSDGGLSPEIYASADSTFGRGFMILYDDVFGMTAASNPQDKLGYAKPFPPGTEPGMSFQIQLAPPPPDFIVGLVPSTYPKGVPLQPWLKIYDGDPPSTANSSGTGFASSKDIWPYPFPTASVTYGTNNTATVTFFATTSGPRFSISLTNVFGTNCPSGT